MFYKVIGDTTFYYSLNIINCFHSSTVPHNNVNKNHKNNKKYNFVIYTLCMLYKISSIQNVWTGNQFLSIVSDGSVTLHFVFPLFPLIHMLETQDHVNFTALLHNVWVFHSEFIQSEDIESDASKMQVFFTAVKWSTLFLFF